MGANLEALSALELGPWAIEPRVLEAIITAVAGDLGEVVKGSVSAYKRESVGILDLHGPITSRDSFFARLFGWSSVEGISSDLRAFESDPEVSSIVVLADTPGGTVNGIADLSAQLKGLSKPVYTFVTGSLASAGYWVGSATNRIIASPTAVIGSIGVVAYATAWSSPGEITVVSSQSPKKNKKPNTEEGLATLQRLVDDTADIFINDVISNRGINQATFEELYGQGDVFLAGDALNRGMIDEINTLERFLSGLTASSGKKAKKGKKMDLKTLKVEFPEVFGEAVREGISAERKRVEAHLILGEASGDLETAIDAIKTGAEMDSLFSAKYQAASMKKAQLLARTADNPTGLDGEKHGKELPGTQGKSAEDQVADLVLAEMSYYLEEGGHYE